MRRLSGITLLLAFWLGACNSDGGNTEGMDRQTSLQFEQYQVQGRKLYLQHCVQCHQPEGEGLASLIPPLAGADFLADTSKVICIIRYGAQNPITVNGKLFRQPMPANPQLTNLEIAEIVTYITNAWGNSGYYLTAEQAATLLSHCTKN